MQCEVAARLRSWNPLILLYHRVTHLVNNRWEIAVTDNGLGVDPAAATTIFEMFGRGSGPARERSGSGIGLAIVKRAVEAHGGVVAVGPRPDGGTGSRFSFTLPRRGATA